MQPAKLYVSVSPHITVDLLGGVCSEVFSELVLTCSEPHPVLWIVPSVSGGREGEWREGGGRERDGGRRERGGREGVERGSEGSEEGAREKGREGVEESEGEERGGEGDKKYEYIIIIVKNWLIIVAKSRPQIL